MNEEKVYAAPQHGHVSLGGSLRVILFFIPVIALGIIRFQQCRGGSDLQIFAGIASVVVFAIIWGILISGIRIAAQWERGIVLRLGKFKTVRGPGIMYIFPYIDNVRYVDLRILTLNIPSQQVITKDNVPAKIDGVLFFNVADVEKAVLEIQDFRFAIAQYAQATLRDVVGGLSLDELLSNANRYRKRSVKWWNKGSRIGDFTLIQSASRTLKCRKI